jgi:hypothetical protein
VTGKVRSWTSHQDVTAKARRVWDRGEPLAQLATGEPFSSLRVTITGPNAWERSAQYDKVRAWIASWRACPPRMKVEWRTVTDKVMGRNDLPIAAHIDTVEDLATLIGKTGEYRWFAGQLAETPSRFSEFMARKPQRVVQIGQDWPAVVSAAAWLADNPSPGIYVRQLPALGVHTKLVESYRREIAELVPMGPAAGNAAGKGWFEARYGFASKPLRARFRFLDPTLPGAPQYSDIEVPVGEAAAQPVNAEHVLVVENEVTFLALPPLPGTVALLGSGNTAPAIIDAVPWLTNRPLMYWGDIDTHGFVILDRVRAVVAGRAPVHSLLMDRDTLLGHRPAWSIEDTPTKAAAANLTADESGVYLDLVTGTFGTGVRLEQERVAWPHALESLAEAVSAGPEAGRTTATEVDMADLRSDLDEVLDPSL